MNDEELAARARQLAEDGVRSAEAQALARELLRQLADRLDPPAQATEELAAVIPPCPRCKTEAPYVVLIGEDDFHEPRDVWRCKGCGHEWSTPREDAPSV